ncbi:hypothetical protein RI129_008163 [Pyrocoelia pectoralis]|uniref:DUF4806 domain-containing protein n=1 Tax=Pyrocoelia pectoralis TaxID=417401 RepID=A0AAN7VAM2_9COLE
MSILLYIKEQNNQILSILRNQNIATTISTFAQLPDDIPIEFPIQTINEIIVIENYLNSKDALASLCTYFSTLGGRDVISRTNNILKKMLSNMVAQEFSFYGSRKPKKAFSKLKLKHVAVRAVQLTCSMATENEICGYIKTWLKHAPQRLSNELKPKKRSIMISS